MGLRRDTRTWQTFARVDPLWAICTDRDRDLGLTGLEDFFRRGEEDVAGVAGFASHLGLALPTGRALDFGCGVGRLSRALAQRCDEVVGVDISSEMVRRASEVNADVENLAFVLNQEPDLSAFDDDSFDFVLSLAVLQHVTDPDIAGRYIAEFIRVTRPGGLVVFQIPSRVARRVRARRLAVRALPTTLIGKVPRLQPYFMSLTALTETHVRAIIERAGGDVAGSVDDHRLGTDAVKSRGYCVVVS